MAMFRAIIREPEMPSGSLEVLFNSAQVVFAFPNPYDRDTTFVRMTGESNVFVVLAPFVDVRQAIEEAIDGKG